MRALPRRRPAPRPALLFLRLFLVASAGCDDGTGPGVVIREPFDFQRDATQRAVLRVTGVNGNITVTGIPGGDTFHATGYRQVRGCSRSEAEEWIDQLEVRVAETEAAIVVETVQPQLTGPCTLEVEYDITVPARLRGVLTDVNGNVTARALAGGVGVTDVNGNVVVEGDAGGVTVRLTNGNVAGGLALEGEEAIDLQTVNGNVVLSIPAGTSAALSAALVNGAISVYNLTLSNAVRTSTSLTGILGGGTGAIVLRTTNGNIVIQAE